MRDRHASLYQTADDAAAKDLERRAEEAARLSGKSVEEWLHDLILEQSATAAQSDHRAMQDSSGRTEKATRDAVLSSLASRVRALEANLNTGPGTASPHTGMQAVADMDRVPARNYDEDARILIEGIRARAQKNQHNPANVSAPAAAATVAANEGDLHAMLDAISRLEAQLAARRPLPTKTQPVKASPSEQEQKPMADPRTAARFAELEDQLYSLETEIRNRVRDVARTEPGAAKSAPRRAEPPSRAGAPGRRALHQAMETIAGRSEAGRSAAGPVYAPRVRPLRADVGRRETDGQYATLIQKIDALQSQTPDITAIERLKAEFADLRRNIESSLASVSAKSDSGAVLSEIQRLRSTVSDSAAEVAARTDHSVILGEIQRLRESVGQMQVSLVVALDERKLDALEVDINRIAEFLLKSPDLSDLPDQADSMALEIRRISDGLLAMGARNDVSTREAGERVANRLEQALEILRQDILGALSNPQQDAASVSAIASELANRLSGLHEHIDRTDRNLSGQFADLHHKMANLQSGARAVLLPELERLANDLHASNEKAESSLRKNSIEMTDQIQGKLDMVHENLVAHLRGNNDDKKIAASMDSALRTHMSGLSDQLSGAVTILSKKVESVEHRVTSAAERLEALGNARGSMPPIGERMDEIEDRLIKAALRLEAASVESARMQGDLPAALLAGTPDTVTTAGLSRELSALETRLNDSLRLVATQPSMPTEVLTADDLKYELSGLADQIRHQLQSQPAPNVSFDARSIEGAFSGFANQLSQSLTSERHELISHIDRAIARLESMAEQQRVEMGEMVRQSTEERARQTKDYLGQDNITKHALASKLKDGPEELASEVTSAAAVSDRTPHQPKVTAKEDLKPQPFVPSFDVSGEDDQSEDDVLEISELAAESENEQAAIFKRMRDHVKARDQEQAPLKPGEDDIPLSPGAGRPLLDQITEIDRGAPRAGTRNAEADRQAIQISQTASTAQTARAAKVRQATEEVEGADYPQKSKVDFIAAARRAAQAAAREESGFISNDEETKSRLSLSSLRERISSVARLGKLKQKGDARGAEMSRETGSDDTALELQEPVSADPKAATVELSAKDIPSIDATTDPVQSFMPEADAASAGTRGSDMRRKILTASLVACLIGAGYIFLKAPVETLLSGLSEHDAPIVIEAPRIAPSIAPNTARNNSDSTLSEGTASETTTENAASRISDPSAVTDSAVTDHDAEVPGGNAAKGQIADPDNLSPADDVASVGAETPAIDYSTTESISPSAVSDPKNTASLINPILAKGFENLPSKGVSEKLRAALLAEDTEAYIEVARRFGEGDIFPRDLSRAAFWYEQAAENGSAVAQFRLATLYEEGIGLAKDSATARRWYEKAAASGNARAMHNLAVLYTEGVFGDANFKEAFNWFEKAAAYGVKDSQFNLGILYVRGLGVEASLPQAYKWFDIVARGGDVDAGEKRDQVAQALNPEQLDAIKKESAAWRKTAWDETANILSTKPDFWQDGTEIRSPVAIKEQISGPSASALVKEAQGLLNTLGFNAGEPDGLIGNKTREAVRSFEYEMGLPQTGKISEKLVEIMKSRKG